MDEGEIDGAIFDLVYYSEGALTPQWAETLGYRRRSFFVDRLKEALDAKAKEIEKMK